MAEQVEEILGKEIMRARFISEEREGSVKIAKKGFRLGNDD